MFDFIPNPESAKIYISLVWFFTVIFTVLVILICYLYLSVRRSLDREQNSFDFSNRVIEELETERRRITRELHDTVLPLVRDMQVSELIRSICRELMPPDFLRLSLKDSLTQLCIQFSESSGIECVCSIEEKADFSPFSAENQLHLYRMVQESFNNIEKHSGAARASLVVRRIPHASAHSILICVSDDGKGMTENLTEGLGMRSMRQRAAILGAKLDLISESSNGLMVRIEIPAGGSNIA